MAAAWHRSILFQENLIHFPYVPSIKARGSRMLVGFHKSFLYSSHWRVANLSSSSAERTLTIDKVLNSLYDDVEMNLLASYR